MDGELGPPGLGRKAAPRWLRLLRRRLPVLAWAPEYSRGAALADLVAGATLGLLLVPQSIAYAALADLPVQYGLYSCFVGTMLYVPLGTVKEVSIGPTSLMALLTLQTCHGLPVQFVVLLSFLAGCVVLAMGVLRLGFLVDLISPAVTSGFTSATAVTIMVAQLKGLLGLSFTAESVSENVQLIWHNARHVRRNDCLLGLGCCALLLLLRKLKDVPLPAERTSLRRALWLVSIGRNALVLGAATVLAYCMHDAARPPFELSGLVEPGLPPVSLPPFSVQIGNRTVPFLEMATQLGSGVVMVPVIMVLGNSAIAKAFSGGPLDATQEMLTLGLCNVLGSLVGAMPTCGAFTRSAVAHASGVRSPLAGLHSGLIALLALLFMTECFYFIPKAGLAAVLVCAVAFMVDVGTVRRLWAEGRVELGALALTFVVGVSWSVELALLCGALASLAAVLHGLMCPPAPLRLHKTAAGEVPVLRPALALLYFNVERLAQRAEEAARGRAGPLLLDCSRLALLDHAAAQGLERLAGALDAAGRRLVVYRASGDVARRLLALRRLDTRAVRCLSADDALLAAAPAGAPAAVASSSGAPPGGSRAAAPLLEEASE